MELKRTNILNLSGNGTFAASGEIFSTPADIDVLFKEIRLQSQTHLVIYVHGGRVSEDAGRVEAGHLMDTLSQVPYGHPLFVLWESSERDIIRHELSRVEADPLFGRLLRLLKLFLVSKLQASPTSVRGLSLPFASEQEVARRSKRDLQGTPSFSEHERATLEELTSAEEEQLGRLLWGDSDLRQSVDEIVGYLDLPGRGADVTSTDLPLGSLTEVILEHLRAEVETEGRSVLAVFGVLAKPAIQVVSRSIIRIRTRLDHGIHCTLVEELLRVFYGGKVGQYIWGAMKRKVHAAFANNEARSSEALHGGTYLLEQMAAYLADSTAPPLRVSLVGHSAGTIFLCALLDCARTKLPQDFRFNQIVFMAPAVDYELCRRAVVEHTDRFDRFVLIALDDAAERHDAIAGSVYPRSLLYFVSGLLDGDATVPLVGLGRYIVAAPPYEDLSIAAVRAFLDHHPAAHVIWARARKAQKEVVLPASHARKHGDFPRDPQTLASVLYFLSGKS